MRRGSGILLSAQQRNGLCSLVFSPKLTNFPFGNLKALFLPEHLGSVQGKISLPATIGLIASLMRLHSTATGAQLDSFLDQSMTAYSTCCLWIFFSERLWTTHLCPKSLKFRSAILEGVLVCRKPRAGQLNGQPCIILRPAGGRHCRRAGLVEMTSNRGLAVFAFCLCGSACRLNVEDALVALNIIALGLLTLVWRLSLGDTSQ
jgi:hypothetical protein